MHLFDFCKLPWIWRIQCDCKHFYDKTYSAQGPSIFSVIHDTTLDAASTVKKGALDIGETVLF